MPRPAKTDVKKGRSTWKPASKLTIHQKHKGFRYRFCDKDQMNIQKKLAEGWQFVNNSTGIPGEHVRPEMVGDDSPMDSATTYRESVVMALPEDIAMERDKYIAERTNAQERDIVKHIKNQADDAGGEVKPKLVIE